MKDTAGDVFDIVAAFLDDPEKDFATEEYLRPFLQQAQRRLFENVFGNPNIGGAKGVVVLTSVAAGTNSLAAYQEDGQPLDGLVGVFSLKEKPTGQTDENYRPMRVVWEVPTAGGGNPSFNEAYSMVGGVVTMPGASQDMDFKLFGEFKPGKIVDGGSVLLPNTATALAHWTAEMVAITRGATDIAAYHKVERQIAVEELFNNLIMHIQETPNQQRPFDTTGMAGSYSFFN